MALKSIIRKLISKNKADTGVEPKNPKVQDTDSGDNSVNSGDAKSMSFERASFTILRNVNILLADLNLTAATTNVVLNSMRQTQENILDLQHNFYDELIQAVTENSDVTKSFFDKMVDEKEFQNREDALAQMQTIEDAREEMDRVKDIQMDESRKPEREKSGSPVAKGMFSELVSFLVGGALAGGTAKLVMKLVGVAGFSIFGLVTSLAVVALIGVFTDLPGLIDQARAQGLQGGEMISWIAGQMAKQVMDFAKRVVDISVRMFEDAFPETTETIKNSFNQVKAALDKVNEFLKPLDKYIAGFMDFLGQTTDYRLIEKERRLNELVTTLMEKRDSLAEEQTAKLEAEVAKIEQEIIDLQLKAVKQGRMGFWERLDDNMREITNSLWDWFDGQFTGLKKWFNEGLNNFDVKINPEISEPIKAKIEELTTSIRDGVTLFLTGVRDRLQSAWELIRPSIKALGLINDGPVQSELNTLQTKPDGTIGDINPVKPVEKRSFQQMYMEDLDKRGKTQQETMEFLSPSTLRIPENNLSTMLSATPKIAPMPRLDTPTQESGISLRTQEINKTIKSIKEKETFFSNSPPVQAPIVIGGASQTNIISNQNNLHSVNPGPSHDFTFSSRKGRQFGN